VLGDIMVGLKVLLALVTVVAASLASKIWFDPNLLGCPHLLPRWQGGLPGIGVWLSWRQWAWAFLLVDQHGIGRL
jgi:hypothetical protein